MAEKTLQQIAQDDKKLRATFQQLQREVFEMEKLKYRRVRDAAMQHLGGAAGDDDDGGGDGDGDRRATAATSASSRVGRRGTSATTSGVASRPNGVNANAEPDVGVFANWRRVLLLAFFILIVQWRRLVNLFDVMTSAGVDAPQ